MNPWSDDFKLGQSFPLSSAQAPMWHFFDPQERSDSYTSRRSSTRATKRMRGDWPIVRLVGATTCQR